MKIKITVSIIAVIIIFLFFAFYINKATETGITVKIEEAINLLSEQQKETIVDIDNPKIEELILEKEPSVYLFNENTKLAGKTLIKYTYKTTQDGLLGPITFYVDKKTGIVLASDYRE
ncbi:MAG: hypothetical protein IKA17_05355 [Clostridia bacterium]|nr:hypothetical protein [Clostridia bacterium]